jgi:hypothetical protein
MSATSSSDSTRHGQHALRQGIRRYSRGLEREVMAAAIRFVYEFPPQPVTSSHRYDGAAHGPGWRVLLLGGVLPADLIEVNKNRYALGVAAVREPVPR